MKVYVAMTHVVAIDVDDSYTDADEAADDPDFWDGRDSNGPHLVLDVDWEVITDPDYYIKALAGEHPLHVVEARVATARDRETLA